MQNVNTGSIVFDLIARMKIVANKVIVLKQRFRECNS